MDINRLFICGYGDKNCFEPCLKIIHKMWRKSYYKIWICNLLCCYII